MEEKINKAARPAPKKTKQSGTATKKRAAKPAAKQAAPKKSTKKSAPAPKANGKKAALPKETVKKETTKKAPAKKSAPKKGAAPKKAPAKRTAKNSALPQGKLRLIPLGGLDEIGKNMTVIEYENDMILIDSGMAFPDEDMPGIDLVIPDFNYLIKNRDKLRGVFITHGHEDHIGSLPYLLKELNVPVYGTRLTLGLVRRKLAEHRLEKQSILIEKQYDDVVRCGIFAVEFIKVNHSIADACGFAVHTPLGVIVHMGDFKIDTTPIRGKMIDLARFGELGKEGVLLMMSDSTNAERPGITLSEKAVGKTFEQIFNNAGGRRIIVATFSSNIHRVQQIINAAVAHGRKVALSGRSMEGVIQVARELGHMNIPEGTIIPLNEISRYPDNRIVLITTGSQGEPMSALYRMAFSDHKSVEITHNDLIIISARPIPGNEKLVSNVVNELEKLGADIIQDGDIHVSGHACQEELKIMLSLIRPMYFMPVHGEYKHLHSHAHLAMETGIKEENIFLSENGKILEITATGAKFNGQVPSGKIFVDGRGVGDVGNIVLRDRKHLSEDGIIIAVATIDPKTGLIISGPDIISRGFVYVKDNEELMNEARKLVGDRLRQDMDRGTADWGTLKNNIRDEIAHFISAKTGRRPMILPILMDI